ncbi:MAG: hypothetical protein Q7R35_16410 [Elusimicrobiota bacterium]|nr:hypothetical protein [Elusimicrobiota bacterium]
MIRPLLAFLVLALSALPSAGQDERIPWNDEDHRLKFNYFTETEKFTTETWDALPPAKQDKELRAALEPSRARLLEVRQYYSAIVPKWDLEELQSYLDSYQSEDAQAVSLWLGEDKGSWVRQKFSSLKQYLAKARGPGLEEADLATLNYYLTPDAISGLKSIKIGKAAVEKNKGKKGTEWKASGSGSKLNNFAGKNPAALTGGGLSGFYDGSKGSGEDPSASGGKNYVSGSKVGPGEKKGSNATTVKHYAPPQLPGDAPKTQPKPAAPAVKHTMPAEVDRGPASYAKTWWKDLEKEQEGKKGFMAGLTKYTAKTAQGLISFSSLADTETSYQTLKVDYKNGASTGTLFKDGAILAKDGALAAVTFIPGANLLKSAKAGDGLIKVAKAGSAVTGMVKAEASTAKAVAKEINAVIKASANSDDVVKGVTEVGKRYGVEVAQGGRIGESVGTASNVVYNGTVGKAHEVVHVVQQVQTRATLGTAAEGSISAFEKVAYAQHEMFAKEATKLLGTEGSGYMSALAKNVGSFETALTNGTVPDAAVSIGSRIYGYIPSLLGTSQAQIAANLGVGAKGVVQGSNAVLYSE